MDGTSIQMILACWMIQVVSCTLSPQGQEPWLVIWKKGVDGDTLWRTLCPTESPISIGDVDAAGFSATHFKTDTAAELLRDVSRIPRGWSSPELVLNCSNRFTQLFNGMAGHFTLKELEIIKSRYKNSLDFVISDRAIQIDSPLELLLTAQQTPKEASPLHPVEQRETDVGHADFPAHSMTMHFPAQAAQPHRQLLFWAPSLSAPFQSIGIRRKLPEQYNATWGLDILDQRQLPLDHIYHYTYNGSGVHVYILDTGIRSTHKEFIDVGSQRTRVVHGFDAVYGTNSSEDCHGHGSHVAAVVGGNTFGVAKNVTLHAVRVLACDGTAMVSALLKGLEWVANNHIKPAIVHMSIEGSFSSIVNQAVEQLIRVHHVHVVVSSGNSGKDACLASPASSPSATTVAAVDERLSRWSYANWGACVDVFAPGVAILSAVYKDTRTGRGVDNSATAFKTGTSMAAPFVTGVVATYLEAHPGASPEEVQQKLYQTAVRGSVTDDPQGFATMFPSQFPDLPDISATPNRMLHANLTSQVVLTPGTLKVTQTTNQAHVINLTLTQRPSSNVTVVVSVPPAWDDTPMAVVEPLQLVITPDSWNQPQTLMLSPRLVCDGDYFVKLMLQGSAEDGFPAIHTVLVLDSRKRSGEHATMARVIHQLPFTITGDTSGFADNYRCQATDKSPDVVYSFIPPHATDVTISTCGSGFDTKLLVSTNLSDPMTYMCNDDDRTCTTNTACSRLDVSFEAGTTYYIVVDGYSDASGEYTLSVRCNPSCPSESIAGAVDSAAPAGSTIGPDVSQGTASNARSGGTMSIIQALLHLSRTTPSSSSPAPTPHVAVQPPAVVALPSTRPSVLAHPGSTPSAVPVSQPLYHDRSRTPPIGSALGRPAGTPGAATQASPFLAGTGSGFGGTGGGTQPGDRPVLQGPLGTLLSGNVRASSINHASDVPSHDSSAAAAAAPGAGTQGIPLAGPLQLIQASSRGLRRARSEDTFASHLPPADADPSAAQAVGPAQRQHIMPESVANLTVVTTAAASNTSKHQSRSDAQDADDSMETAVMLQRAGTLGQPLAVHAGQDAGGDVGLKGAQLGRPATRQGIILQGGTGEGETHKGFNPGHARGYADGTVGDSASMALLSAPADQHHDDEGGETAIVGPSRRGRHLESEMPKKAPNDGSPSLEDGTSNMLGNHLQVQHDDMSEYMEWSIAASQLAFLTDESKEQLPF